LHDVNHVSKSGGEIEVTTPKTTTPINKEEALKALQGTLDTKPASTPPTDLSTKPATNPKTAHKPVHKAVHVNVKPHQSSSTGSTPRPPREQPNDAEIWNEHIQKY
jgi:hypothetical protein